MTATIIKNKTNASLSSVEALSKPNTNETEALPKSWKWTKLGELIDNSLIGIVRANDLQNTVGKGVPYLKMNNIDLSGHLQLENLVYVEISNDELKKYSLKENDVLINTRNSYELVGKSGIVEGLVRDTVFNNNIMRLRFNNDVSPKFISYQLISQEAKANLTKEKKATTNICALYQAEIYGLSFKICELSKQQSIVSKIEQLFTEVDAGITKLKDAQKQLSHFKQSVLKEAFIPKDGEVWETKKLGEVAIFSSEKYQPKGEVEFFVGLEHIEKETGKLTDKVGEEKITTIKNRFHKGDILYGKLRPNLSKAILAERDGVCSTDILVLKTTDDIDGKYLHKFMLSKTFVDDCSFNTSGVNLPRVSTKYLENYPIPLPKIKIQQRIVKQFQEQFEVANEIEDAITKSLKEAELLKQSILKQAFEGRLI